MSRRDDEEDEIELTMTPPKPAARSNVGYVTPDGKVTSRGLASLKEWWCSSVTDDVSAGDVDLEVWEAGFAFEKSSHGFPMSGDDNETKVVEVNTDEFTSAVQSFSKVEVSGDHFLGRRLRDELGVQFRRSDGPPEPIEWLVRGILPERSVSLLVAPPYELKTWIALSLSRAVSHGEPWLGKFGIEKENETWIKYLIERGPNLPLRCIHLDYEMGPVEMDRRLHLLKDARTGRSSLCPLTLADPKLWNEQLPLLKPDFVTVDSLARGNPGVDENGTRFAEPLARAKEYAAKHGTTFLFLAHSGKNRGGKELMDVIRGSSAIAAAIDCAYFLQSISAADADDPRERRARMTCLKMRTGGDEPEPFLVKLTNAGGVELYERKAETVAPAPSKEDRVEAVVVAEPGSSCRHVSEVTGIRQETVAALLKDLETDGRVRSEPGGKGLATRYFAASVGAPNDPAAEHSGAPPTGAPPVDIPEVRNH